MRTYLLFRPYQAFSFRIPEILLQVLVCIDFAAGVVVAIPAGGPFEGLFCVPDRKPGKVPVSFFAVEFQFFGLVRSVVGNGGFRAGSVFEFTFA